MEYKADKINLEVRYSKMKTKICHTCKRELPATTQYFYKFKHAKDGLKSSCKECQGGRFKAKEKTPEGYRRCHDCKRILPETEEFFLKYWNKKEQRYYYKCHCLECGKKRSKAWREANSERYREYYTEYAKSPAGREVDKRWKEKNPEKVKEQKQKYRENNRDKIQAYDRKRRTSEETREKVLGWSKSWRAENPERVRSYNSQYAKGNPEYFRAAAQKRAAKKKSLACSLSLEEWEKAKAFFNNECAYCGKKLKRLTQDHVIPLSKGGTYTADNIIPACKSCNSSKHDKDFEEWYKSQPSYTLEREKRIKEYLINMAIPR